MTDTLTTTDTHDTAPNRYVEAGGVTYAHRRFGADTGTPLVFLQHLRGSMDYWDPAVTDAGAVRAAGSPGSAVLGR